jgi:hypothetical protein
VKKRKKAPPKLPKWRDFEQLVARIEQCLVPKGAVVKSPDRIRDKVTNELREVDASIRFQVGSTPILIAIECRKRKPVQDVTWIEQLATKSASIGAARMIAVSATGFSDSAVKLAQLHGIELRQFEDRIGEEIVQKFLSGFHINMIVTDYHTRSIMFTLDGGQKLRPEDSAPELMDALKRDGVNAVVATEVVTGSALTIEHMMHEVDDSKAPLDGPAITVRAAASFTPGAVTVSTKQGPRFLSEIEVIADFSRKTVPLPARSLYEYSTPDSPIRHTIDAVGALSETEGVRVLVDISSPTLERRPSASPPPAANPPHDAAKTP